MAEWRSGAVEKLGCKLILLYSVQGMEQRVGEWGAFYAFRSKRTGSEHLSLGRSTATHGGRFHNEETAGHLTVTARRYSGSSYGYKPLPSRPEITNRMPAGTLVPSEVRLDAWEYLKYSYFLSCSPRTAHSKWQFISVKLQEVLNVSHGSGVNVHWRILAAFCLAYFSNLKIEATCSFEMLTEFQRNTRRYIPEDRTLHNHWCESLKSYKWFSIR
jgi:hypothetical protein